ncbi:MAG: class I SAM-dependent methyltransferase [Thermoanaerobaculia bacterium]|nr:class I SAM-dependent methyltransferase [Thermoanaerobaculia bacterium]
MKHLPAPPDREGFDQSSENAAVQGTLLSNYSNPLIREARERQDEILRSRFQGQRLAIADLGCGDGYHGSIFAPAGGTFHGYEMAPDLAALTRERWQREGLANAVLKVGNLAAAEPPGGFYDVVWCLYFTPGNFRDRFADLDQYTDDYLDANPVFIDIVGHFWRALKPTGVMLLTVYKDVPEAEAAQLDFYRNTGQHPITSPGSRFVATREGFWSARWTRESLLSNLAGAGISASRVTFNELNEIAWLVEIAAGSVTEMGIDTRS